MAIMKSLSIFLVIAISCIAATDAATFNITNNCTYPVWAAAVPGGGARLNTNESWTFNVNNGTTGARIWGRTNCTFDTFGRGKCETGDCNGTLNCTSYGAPPNTLVEYSLNQYNNLDYYDISLVNGFNLPLQFNPISNGCNRTVTCAADINAQCPSQLKVPGGCNNPCTVFKTDQYCCTGNSSSCEPTTYSRLFKNLCPDACSYPMDDTTSMFTCPGQTNYTVVFCP